MAQVIPGVENIEFVFEPDAIHCNLFYSVPDKVNRWAWKTKTFPAFEDMENIVREAKDYLQWADGRNNTMAI